MFGFGGGGGACAEALSSVCGDADDGEARVRSVRVWRAGVVARGGHLVADGAIWAGSAAPRGRSHMLPKLLGAVGAVEAVVNGARLLRRCVDCWRCCCLQASQQMRPSCCRRRGIVWKEERMLSYLFFSLLFLLLSLSLIFGIPRER